MEEVNKFNDTINYEELGESFEIEKLSVDNNDKIIDNHNEGDLTEHQEDNANKNIVEEQAEKHSNDAEDVNQVVDNQERFIDISLPNGGIEKITEKELINSYFRQSDYTRKTQELAQQRTQQEADFLDKTTAIINKYNPLTQLEAQYNAIYQQAVEAREIGDTDNFNTLRLDLMQIEKTINATKSEINTLLQAKQWQDEQATSNYLANERQKLFDAIPELKNPEKTQEFQKLTYDALVKVGYSEDEVSKLKPDARQAQLAYFAGQYLKMQNNAPQVAKTIADKVVSSKPSNVTVNKAQNRVAELERLAAQGDDNAHGELIKIYYS